MNEAQQKWTEARDRLASAADFLGFPPELTDLMARELQSPRAMDRMTAYLIHVRPRSMEMLADELLAIRADADAWRERKAAREAQASYNAHLFAREREPFDPLASPERDGEGGAE